MTTFTLLLIATFALVAAWIVRSVVRVYRKHGPQWAFTSLLVWLWPF